MTFESIVRRTVVTVFSASLSLSAVAADIENTIEAKLSLAAEAARAIDKSYGGENFDPDAWRAAKKQFVNSADKPLDQQRAAVRDLLGSLDNSAVRMLLPKEKTAFIKDITGTPLPGIGLLELLSVDIDERSKRLTVVTPIPGSAAAVAGLRSGDIIVAVNGRATANRSLAQSAAMIRGAVGLTVDLTIEREGERFEVKIECAENNTSVPVVRSFVHSQDNLAVGYLQYLRVDEGSAEKMRRHLDVLIAEGVDSIVLDLRNNPGGAVTDSVAVADMFLPKGTSIVKVIAGKQRVLNHWKAESDPLWEGALAVLQNAGSASAAELIAGALQDNKRAMVVGSRSFGKGLMHTMAPLADGSAIMFHVGRLVTPAGRDILHQMIEADIEIEMIPSPVMSVDQREVASDKDKQFLAALAYFKRHR